MTKLCHNIKNILNCCYWEAHPNLIVNLVKHNYLLHNNKLLQKVVQMFLVEIDQWH